MKSGGTISLNFLERLYQITSEEESRVWFLNFFCMMIIPKLTYVQLHVQKTSLEVLLMLSL